MTYRIKFMAQGLTLALLVSFTFENHAFAFGSAPQPVPTPTPTVTSTPKPTPSPSPSPSPTVTPKPSPSPSPSPTPTQTTTPAGIYLEKITTIASKSSCATYSWADRGKAPAGYIKGMALSFARSVCRSKGLVSASSPATVMGKGETGATSTDALAWYESTFDGLGMEIRKSGEEVIQSLYTLGIGLGMRESSGKYCEGYDASAGTETASEAEAGTFQASYNSIAASSELTKLYNEYKADPSRCQLDTYKEGATCKTQSIVGTGAGADYQVFAKSCPAFTAEYAMTGLRVLRKHWGPINRKEAEVKSQCNTMLEDVRKLVDEDPANACRDVR